MPNRLSKLGVKGIIHPFTHLFVVPNLYDFILPVAHKIIYFEKRLSVYLFKVVLDPLTFKMDKNILLNIF